MPQALLFPDPKPLDQRLGATFFRRAPRRPGVYVMKDEANKVLYIGKAKNLRQRLNSYRLANPDRMPPRHLRLVRQVARIEFEFCANESAALRRESKLLRSLKPGFNRAGVWPVKSRFIAWRLNGVHLELSVVDVPEPAWRRYGPLNGGARPLHHALARLLWLATTSKSAIGIPAGWAHGRVPDTVTLDCGVRAGEILAKLEGYFWETPEYLSAWLNSQFTNRSHPFEHAAIGADLDILQAFTQKRATLSPGIAQLPLL